MPLRTEKEKLVGTFLKRMAGMLGVGMLTLVACTDSGNRSDARFQGLQTVVYAAPDLKSATKWYTEALGIEPYFVEDYYVGFNVGGYELALDPDRTVARPAGAGAIVYWGVDDVEEELNRLLGLGAKQHTPFHDVGGGIKVGTVLDPFGNAIGLIFNPRFKNPD